MYRKKLFYRGLNEVPVYIEDTFKNSPYYFNIVEIPSIFGPGKNSIKFNLNDNNLDIYKNIDVEIVDSYGNTVYYEVPAYTEPDEQNLSILTVYIYDDIANGPLNITFIGHAKIGLSGELIPEEFKNKYNVRYSTVVDFNRYQKNTSRIAFSTNPIVSVNEVRSAYVSRSYASGKTITESGSATYRFNYTYPILELPQDKSFINDMINGVVVLTGTSFYPTLQGYSTSSYSYHVSRINGLINDKVATLATPWTASITALGDVPKTSYVNYSDVSAYTLVYRPTPQYTGIENYKSFVNLTINNMDPVSGYVKQIKLYGKSQGSLDQYELIGESFSENFELLINSASLLQYDRRNVGYFLDSSSFQNFWTYNNTLLSASFNSSSLFNSLYLQTLVDGYSNKILFTSNIPIPLQEGSPYHITFNYKEDIPFKMEVYISGSAAVDKNLDQIGESVYYIDSEVNGHENKSFSIDFLASQTGTANLRFRLLTGSLYISDISFKSGITQGFNPSNFNAYFPIEVKSRNDVYDFKVDLIDDNEQVTSYIFTDGNSSNISISGSNYYIDGNDNLLPGTLRLGTTNQGGVNINGISNQITTYDNSKGWVFWSGSQTVSGSIQSGSGIIFETGAPYYHFIKGSVGGQITISGSGIGGSGSPIDTSSFATTSSNTFTGINTFNQEIKVNSITSTNKVTGISPSVTKILYTFDPTLIYGADLIIHAQDESDTTNIGIITYHVTTNGTLSTLAETSSILITSTDVSDIVIDTAVTGSFYIIRGKANTNTYTLRYSVNAIRV
jgi:hypothetical protein